MKKLFLLLSLGFAGVVSALGLPDYEPFADATASGGTSYTAGSALAGQTNAQGLAWFTAGPPPVTNQPTLSNINLSYAGLAPSSGGSAVFGGIGTSARFGIGSSISSGSLYYSFIMDVQNTNGMSTSGVFWFGFNNVNGAQATTPTTVGTRVITKLSGTGFQIGLDKSSGTTASFVFDPTIYNLNTPILIVGSYTFNTGTTTDDISRLWINPTSLGGADAAGALSSTAGNDVSPIQSVVLFDRSTGEPAAGLVDELRIGTSFADVTPTTAPEPSVLALGALALAGFAVRSRK